MAASIVSFACTIGAGATTSFSFDIGNDYVTAIHWRVPPGPRGHLAWYITQSGVRVLPDQRGQALVADGESDTWDVSEMQESGAWGLTGQNTGQDAHTVYLEFYTVPASVASTTTSDILVGFPVSDSDIPGLWLA